MQINLSKIRPVIQRYRWQIAVGSVLAAVLFFTRREIVATLSNITDKALWCKKLYGVVSTELPQIPTLSRLIIVAQAAYESGYGKGRAATGINPISKVKVAAGNNFFNITAGSAWRGEQWLCQACDTDGQGRPIDQHWRSYPSVNSGVQDYWSFIGPGQNGGRYVKAQQALLNGDLPGFIYALHAGGYFTLDPAEYLSQMSGVVNTVRRFIST